MEDDDLLRFKIKIDEDGNYKMKLWSLPEYLKDLHFKVKDLEGFDVLFTPLTKPNLQKEDPNKKLGENEFVISTCLDKSWGTISKQFFETRYGAFDKLVDLLNDHLQVEKTDADLTIYYDDRQIYHKKYRKEYKEIPTPPFYI